MNKYITSAHYDMLSDKAKKRLDKEFLLTLDDEPGDNYYSKNPTEIDIADMIAFLKNNSMGDLDLIIYINNSGNSVWTGIGKQENKLGGNAEVDLCDALWEAVKNVLER